MKILPLNRRTLFVAICGLVALQLVPGIPQRGAKAALSGEFSHVHDPSRITACEGKYYLYYTGDRLPMRWSSDMIRWNTGAPVLEKVPDSLHELVPEAKGNFIWAPDVIKVKNEYWLFYSYSTFGSRISAIGLVSSPTLNPENPAYKWTDRGVVISSNNQVNYNAIDPAPVWDEAGDLWLGFGSWQPDGIQMVQLDKETGKAIGRPITIARGQAKGPEAAYIHFHDGYFYQFENEGDCCKGMNSTYRVMVGRSKTVIGPYLDKAGNDLAKAGGTVFLESKGVEIGPGHIGIYNEGGVDHVTFHYYDGRNNGTPTLGKRTLIWGADGWPVAVPDLPGGHYAISSKPSGLALGLLNRNFDDGALIEQTAFRDESLQGWNLIPLNDGFYGIASLASGKYINLADDGKVTLQPWQNNDNQRWLIEGVGEGAYRITSKASRKALGLPASKAPGTLLQSGDWKGAEAQNWVFRAFHSN